MLYLYFACIDSHALVCLHSTINKTQGKGNMNIGDETEMKLDKS